MSLKDRFYYECRATTATVRLSQLNKSQRKAVFAYYDEVWLPMRLHGPIYEHIGKGLRRQQLCEEMIQIHITKESLLEFLKEVGYYGGTEVDC